jgi:hypothetical protein
MRGIYRALILSHFDDAIYSNLSHENEESQTTPCAQSCSSTDIHIQA